MVCPRHCRALILSTAAIACGPAILAAPTNYASLGTASADSAEFGSTAAAANDGNRDGEFGNGSVWHSNNTGETWYEVDLGQMLALDRVQVFNRTDNGRYPWWDLFKIEVRDSSDNLVFSKDYLTQGGGTDWAWAANDMRNVVGQRVRIYKDTEGAQAAMAEFEVYAQNEPIATNLALSATVTGSVPGYGSELIDLNDGDIDGNFGHGSVYHSAELGIGMFVQLDLGSTQALDYINVFGRTDAGTTGPVKLSVLDESMSEVFSTNIALWEGYDFTTLLPGSTNGRYVKVETLDAQPLAITEIEIFGLNSAVLGDTDGDGDVDDFDLIKAISAYTGSLDPGAGGKTVADGDTDGDGDVDDFDLINMISGYTGSLSAPSVPEPGTIALLSIASVMLARRKRPA